MDKVTLDGINQWLIHQREEKGVALTVEMGQTKAYKKYIDAVSNRNFGALAESTKLTQLGLNRYLDGIQPPEFDLLEQAAVYDAEPIVRTAISRQINLWLKEPPVLLGEDKYVEYIQERLNEIAFVSKIPTNELWRTMLRSLLKFSNAFAIVIRSSDLSSGVKVQGRQPIAAIFPVSALTMFPKFEKGRIIKWVRVLPDGRRYQEFDPKDVIHLTFDKEEEFVFGKPRLLGSIEDVAALRRIEENIEILMAKFLFPIYHMIVGTPEKPCQYYPNGESEIDVARYQIQGMDQEGMAITSERVKFDVIGSFDQALDAGPYLEHFKKRLYAGLGVSAIDVGEGDTANRSTADNISQNLKDRVLEDQISLADQIHMQIFLPLIQEHKDGWSAIKAFNKVKLRFVNVDLDNRIKYENHLINLWNNNLLLEEEAREKIGMPAFSNADRMRTRFFLQDVISLVIGSSDEKWTGESAFKKILAAVPEATGVGGGMGNKVAGATGGRPSKPSNPAANAVKIKSQPTNQFGTNPGPTRAKSSLEKEILTDELIQFINFIGSAESDEDVDKYAEQHFEDQKSRDLILSIGKHVRSKLSLKNELRAEMVSRLLEVADKIIPKDNQ